MQQPQRINPGPVLPKHRSQENIPPEKDTYIIARWRIEVVAELQQISQRVLSDPDYTPTQLIAELDSYRFAFREVNKYQ
ncbi:MAG: hypothetical protein AAFZ49_00135 [Cyanobacteria bacterium J06659_2]